MKSRDFCYWLQGLFELGNINSLDAIQTDKIKKHLAMVFKHEIDPSAGSTAHQQELSELHGKPTIGGVDPLTGMTLRC